MKHRSQIDRIVDETFHSVILEFNPVLPDTYRRCVEDLKNLEHKIESSGVKLASKRALLVRVRTHLALMASEMNDNAEAERLTAGVLAIASTKDPDFATAALIRTKILHLLGKHEKEVEETLEYAESEAFTGHALVHLLAEHP